MSNRKNVRGRWTMTTGPRAVLVAVLVCATAFIGFAQAGRVAELVILDATVHTLNDAAPEAQAVAVTEGRIVAVGSTIEVRRLVGPGTRVIDGRGLTVTPGLIEAHGHMMGLGWSKKFVSLASAESYDEIVRRVADAVGRAKPGEWIVGGGWHQDKWTSRPSTSVRGFPVHDQLSRVSPNNPVFLAHASGHAALANSAALALAGVDGGTPAPAGGEIIRDAGGRATGVLTEAAQGLVASKIPPPGAEAAMAMLDAALAECVANGITSFHDAAVDRQTFGLYKRYAESGRLPVRIYALLAPGRDGSDRAFIDEQLRSGPLIGYGNGYLTARGLKLFIDGALGSRGAWLLAPYADDPGNSGQPVLSPRLVYEISARALAAGFQVGTHAIGDRAVREILNAYERAFRDNPAASANARFRIEHAQHVSEVDIPRFAKLGVIAAMQGIHMSSDISWARDRLGDGRIAEGAYVWQKLLSNGALIANGTDVPVEPIDPVANFYASVTRRTRDGVLFPWSHPEQAMTRIQALRSYTKDAAYAAFEEGVKGSIEPGKLADLTLFSQDLLAVAEEKIRDTKIAYTIVGGRVVYEGGK